MSESAKARSARKAFAQRLKGLRLDAGLTGRALSEFSGIHNTKISSIEHARLSPSEKEIRAWATACGVPGQAPELIAAHRVVALMWLEYRQRFKVGIKNIQWQNDLYERTRLFRIYESNRLPGLLQQPGYARALMNSFMDVWNLPGGKEELDGAVAGRLSTRPLMMQARARFVFILEVGALDLMVGGPEAMHEQYDFLLEVTRLPNVALGVIPPAVPRAIWAGEGFHMFDDAEVRSEQWTGKFVATNPDDISPFRVIFEKLRRIAVYDQAARDLIEAARANLPS